MVRNNKIYKLIGVVVYIYYFNFQCHIGNSSTAGHYYSYCKKENTWYKCNDKIVEEIKSNEYISNEAYILFYERNDENNNPKDNKRKSSNDKHSDNNNDDEEPERKKLKIIATQAKKRKRNSDDNNYDKPNSKEKRVNQIAG